MVVPLSEQPVTGAYLFGKLPTHGDFVSRGYEAVERDRLDDWMSASMADARAVWGEAFDGLFDQAPPWRFAIRSGAAWRAGAIVPSIDGVGRRYPMLAALDIGGEAGVIDAAMHCERRLYDAFEQSWQVDRLLEALAATVSQSEDDWPGGEGWWTMGGGSFEPTTIAGPRPPDLVRAMLTMREVAA